jgi:hypothetical protein
MTAKFIKQINSQTSQVEWLVETACGASGQKATAVGDIIKINRRAIKITQIVSTDVVGGVAKYGDKTVAKFANF